MTHQPPLPAAATTPYPLHPAPIPDHPEQRQAPEASCDDESSTLSATAKAGIGAAFGIGSAALVAALLYARRSTNEDRKPRRSKPDRRSPASKRASA